jgi:hypothetical protein
VVGTTSSQDLTEASWRKSSRSSPTSRTPWSAGLKGPRWNDFGLRPDRVARVHGESTGEDIKAAEWAHNDQRPCATRRSRHSALAIVISHYKHTNTTPQPP